MTVAGRALLVHVARRRLLAWCAAWLVVAGLAGAAPAQAGIYARNTPEGRCVITASLPGVGPWDLRLQRRSGGRWVGWVKPTTWSPTRAEFACRSQRRARVRVRALASSGSTAHTSTVRQPEPIVPQVRLIYARPRDRAARAEFATAIAATARTVQAWYREQMGGRTFRLSRRGVERCVLPREAARYAHRTYDRVLADLQRCLPVGLASPGYTWLAYVDVDHACKAKGLGLGVGSPGLAVLPRSDLDGIAGLTARNDCGEVQEAAQGRWVGGAAHELGHAFGLPHPPGCDRGRPSCDASALMWQGYSTFPAAYLRASDRARLRRSSYFTTDWS